MKTLKAFWHWVDNEKPSPELYAEKAGHSLSDLAEEALIEAERLVGLRAGAGFVEQLDRVSDEEHRHLRPAFRDMSLALCAALEHMHGQVEDDYLGKRYPARPVLCTLADWLPEPARYGTTDQLDAAAFQRSMLTEPFRGVDSGRYESRLADARPAPFLMNDDGLKLRPEFAGPYYRKVGSTWASAKRELQIYTSIDVDGVNRLRGLSPRSIIVRGKLGDYQPVVLDYLGQVISPMVADGAVVTAPEDPRLLGVLGLF